MWIIFYGDHFAISLMFVWNVGVGGLCRWLFPSLKCNASFAGLYNRKHLFIVSGILLDCIWKCLTMILQWIPLLDKNYTNNIVGGIRLDFKWLFVGMEMWGLVQSRGNASTWKTHFIGIQKNKFSFGLPLVTWLKGQVLWENPNTNLRWKLARPRKIQSFIRVVGADQSQITCILARSTCTPCSKWCSPNIESGSYKKCISPNWHTICTIIGFGGLVGYGVYALPNFTWRPRCHPGTLPRTSW